MSDERLRDLERRWHESGTPEAARALLRELIRVGRIEVPKRDPCPGCGERLVVADLEPTPEVGPAPHTAVGEQAVAHGAGATAVGAYSNAAGDAAAAVGHGAMARYRGTAIGHNTYAEVNGVAIGPNAHAPPGRVAISRLGLVDACAFCGLVRAAGAAQEAAARALALGQSPERRTREDVIARDSLTIALGWCEHPHGPSPCDLCTARRLVETRWRAELELDLAVDLCPSLRRGQFDDPEAAQRVIANDLRRLAGYE